MTHYNVFLFEIMGKRLPVSSFVPGFQVGVANMKWEEPLDGV